ncbi:MAG: biotin transporter BioY [Stackebrandtia sp.]
MALHTATLAPRRVLADLLPGVRALAVAREAVLVLGGAAAVGATAQVAITIPAISPVPFVLTTLTVLLLGAAYGPARAAGAMGIYLAAGVAGMPWFSEGASGPAIPTLGYVVGFLAAAVVVGALARRGGDRTMLRTSGLMLAGTAIIYACGVPYLVLATGMSWSQGLFQGAAVFLISDLLKLLVAAVLLPGAWAAVKRFSK